MLGSRMEDESRKDMKKDYILLAQMIFDDDKM